MRGPLAFALIVVLVVGTMGAGSFLLESMTTTTASAQAPCSAPLGVYRTNLSSQQFGEVTTFQLPEPLRAPNSITAALDGSVWFGEIGLRGVAHLYENGTLVEYPWPPSFFSGTSCFDLSELWGLVIWKDAVWASDSPNNQLVGLNPSNDSFSTIQLRNDSLPRSLAIDSGGNLWFTESSTAQIGMVNAINGTVSYYAVPAGVGEFSASALFYNGSLAYVVTVNPDGNYGKAFSFNPLEPESTFQQVGGNQTLLAPYSVAVADGGLWVSEHDASNLAFYNQTSKRWSFYPTSVNPDVALSLPYYLIANGTEVWFNEHDSNRVGEICCDAASLTEYNMSQVPLKEAGIGNALTIGIDRNLLWFTEWTGNQVGYVNSSIPLPFSLSLVKNSSEIVISPGSSTLLMLTASGDSRETLSWLFADSESHASVPNNISFQTNSTTISGLDGSRNVALTVSAGASTPAGDYILLVTLTDSFTYRSVYIHLVVT